MAKDPRDRPADAASLVTMLRAAASPAYGQDWDDRGRSHLGEAALLLAALWPSDAAPAVHGNTVEQVHLSQGRTSSMSTLSTSSTSIWSTSSTPDSPASLRQATQAPSP
jgi:hypothetical protein